MRITVAIVGALLFSFLASAQAPEGYYRFPSLHSNTLVFTAEGDLWKTSAKGGVAQRLTTHLGQERDAKLSPDGQTIAFLGHYEGPPEVYTMPVSGGLPVRQTWHGQVTRLVGWTPGGEILYATRKFSTLPNTQLVALDTASHANRVLPLEQADQGVYADDGSTLFFTRLPFQGSHAKRYQGGTAQNLWKFTGPGQEAVPLTADYAGTSKDAMWWSGRVYFLSDRDGTMNVWSMNGDGGDLRQHTKHAGWDAQSPSLHDGRIAYQLGADIHIVDLADGRDHLVPITIASDLDQTRERWVAKPADYISAVHLSPKGDRVAITARGELFVAPVQSGRLAEVTRRQDVRYRDGRFLPDGKSLVALSDESGEVELWQLDAAGLPEKKRLTSDGTVLRWKAVPSPDGKWIAHDDKDQQLWLLEVESATNRKIAESANGGFDDIRWSPDSGWLSWTETADNDFNQVIIYNLASGERTQATTDRFNSHDGSWSADGKWLYLLSDRSLNSSVRSPWGSRQPEPFFDKSEKIYHIALQKEERSPFQPVDEVHAATTEKEEAEKKDKDKRKAEEQTTEDEEASKKEEDEDEKPPEVKIDIEGIAARLIEVPAPPGNYSGLFAGKKYLYWISRVRDEKPKLMRLEIKNEGDEPEELADDVRGAELSLDTKKLMMRKGTDILVIDADKKLPTEKKALAKVTPDLKGWTFALDPREELRQMFDDAWRLHRDYFYDRGMHQVDWPAMRNKYRPLLARVTDRAELSDLLAQMVGELSTLHTFVGGGDQRQGLDQVSPASLGAALSRVDSAGGYRVDHIYRVDPDYPEKLAPLSRPEVNVLEGDIILAINGASTLSEPDIGVLLRNRADKQTRLRVRAAAGGEERDVIIKPITQQAEADLRYEEWEYTRRLRVEELGGGQIGYVHLRAMGSGDIAQWARNYYPIYKRKGLILDVRHNRGGNIDSWILEKLLRKAWFYWQPRVGALSWNMQYAFRGHMVVLCDEATASDGEAFAEGFRRLGLGKLIGVRTWGGEIWLSASNRLVDRGIATAAELGVFGPEGEWLIEGHGVDPDIVVDNLPHASFGGEDAQLKAGVEHLQRLIAERPVELPRHPDYPDKSFGDNKKR